MQKLRTIAALAVTMVTAVSSAAVTINVASTLQEMSGFGVSQAFGRASQFEALAATPRKQGLDFLFSTSTGAGLTIIRNRIGSGGTGDSIEPTSPGSPGATPKYVFDDNDMGQVWFSQQAMTYGVSTIYADAWSAPGFMKTNDNEADGGFLCGVTGETCSSGDWRQAYANLLVQYVRDYASVGVPITHLGFLNEPDFVATYSSMQSSGAQAASFIPILRSTLDSAGLSSVQMTCCDATGWPNQQTMTTALVNAGSTGILSVITSHAYSGDPNSAPNSHLPVWMTEWAPTASSFVTTWFSSGAQAEGLTLASKIQTGILNANLSAYLYWEGVEVNQPGASSYLVASDGTNTTPSGRLWALAMFSRFVRPGAKRVATSGTVSSTAISAFRNTDGSVVAVSVNTGASAQSVTFSLSGFTPRTATAFLQDNTHTVAAVSVVLSGSSATVSIPANSVVTVKMT